MISMTYSCKCGFKSSVLDDAQGHADEEGHNVDLVGSITPRTIQFDTHAIELSAARKARESEIMRQARDRGLLDKKGVRA